MRVRGLVLLWCVAGLIVWCGFFDILLTRGEKEYVMRQALHDAGQGPPADMARIMRDTSHDAAVTASLFAVPVVVVGLATIWLMRRGQAADVRTQVKR